MNRKMIWLAVIIGFTVIGWMFWRDFDAAAFSTLKFSPRVIAGLLLAVCCMALQNFGMTWRYRLLTHRFLTWPQAFRANIICEFTSAVTPSLIGGGGLIFLSLYKEGLSAGKSTAVMIASLFMDELFLCLSSLAVIALFPNNELFGGVEALASSIKWLFLIVLGGIICWTALLYTALFHKPQWVSSMLLGLFSLPFLRRWKEAVHKMTDDLETGSNEMKKDGWRFLVKPFVATGISWCCRYAVVSALLFAFGSPGGDQLLAYVRQWILWIIAMITPTPGGSGMNEYMFKTYYKDFFPSVGITIVVALVWRIITYYSYLIAGACIIPQWLKAKEHVGTKVPETTSMK